MGVPARRAETAPGNVCRMGEVSMNVRQDAITPEYFIAHFYEYLPRYIAGGAPTADTRDTYELAIRLFLHWCMEQNLHPLSDVHDYQIRIYMEEMRTRGYSAATLMIKGAAIRAFYKVAQRLSFIAENPCADLQLRNPQHLDEDYKYLTVDQIKEICEGLAADQNALRRLRNLLIVYLMGVEGLRVVEVMRLSDEDIDWQRGRIEIRGKGHAGIIYPCEETFQLLKAYIEERGPVPPESRLTPTVISCARNNAQGRITRVGIRYVINKALTDAGLKQPGYACHLFRHSCGTNLYQETKDLRVVQETLRQRSPKVTAKYAHVHDRMERRYTRGITPGLSVETMQKEAPSSAADEK
ncbi:tyrosine-type recombinase/integrase [Selenomonas noxia]